MQARTISVKGFKREDERGLTRCRVYLVQSDLQARANEPDVREDQQLYSTSTTLDLREMRRVIFQSPETLDGPIIIHM